MLSGVNGTLNTEASLGFLLGDVNGSRSISAADTSGVKSRSGQLVDGSNFQFDINTSGVITAADIAAVKARPQVTLP